MKSVVACAGSLLALVTLVGCSSAEDDKSVPVSGEVILNGEPLPGGIITFLPTNGKGATAGAQIKEGAYSTRIAPGPKKVTITATREIPNSNAKTGPHAGPPVEQYIPPRYNLRSTLQAEIPKGGADDIDFELTTGRG